MTLIFPRKVYLKTKDPSQFSYEATTRPRDTLAEEVPISRAQSSTERQNDNDDNKNQRGCALM